MMKTQTINSKPGNARPGRRLALVAALSLVGAALAMPALADHDDDDDVYRPAISAYQGYGYNYRHRARGGYGYDRYAWLNRVNRYGVRGRIVAWGRGSLRGCFRIKRSGRYYRSPAIVTVRYCQNGYGRPYAVRGSKLLVRYLDPYRRAGGYDYRRPLPRY